MQLNLIHVALIGEIKPSLKNITFFCTKLESSELKFMIYKIAKVLTMQKASQNGKLGIYSVIWW